MNQSENPFRRIPPVDERELVCELGDRLVVHTAAKTEEGDSLLLGSLYQVVDRKYYGRDLKLDRGTGAPVVRVLNSKVLSYFAYADSKNA